ncbi:hypothetical protein J6V85_02355 [Candidatus Saccharibacteria bacterium]|nr:hypothetical protein [Candidatus Saccharibacteria bacterium]
MSIYDLDLKGMKKSFAKFNKTLYGKTVFFIAYFIPFLSFLALIGAVIAVLFVPTERMQFFTAISLAVFIISFFIGNAYFYRELRIFLDKK